MRKILKKYNFNSDMQYYEMIAESFISGQNTSAKLQFKILPKKNKIQLLKCVCFGMYKLNISQTNLLLLFDLI